MVQILTQFNDSLTLGDDTIPAQDTVIALDGSDTLLTDETVGGSVLFGNRDSDSLLSRSSGNVLYGGQENDQLLSLNSGGSVFFGDLGDDVFESFGGTGKDTVFGGTSTGDASDGDDVFNFGNGLGGNLGFGNTGDDFLSGSGFGNDTLYGGQGDDTIQVVEVSGGSGTGGGSGFVPESIVGGTFTVTSALNQNTVGGTTTTTGVGVVDTLGSAAPLNPGKNYLSGDLGDDLVIGLGDRDSLFGGVGTDTLVMLGNIDGFGQAGENENTSIEGAATNGLNGNPQNASLWGGEGDDSVVAFGSDRGRNTLVGGAGNDTIRNVGIQGYVRGDLFDGSSGGNDSITQEGFGESTLWGGGGDDTIDSSSSGGTNLVYGDGGSDVLTGSQNTTQLTTTDADGNTVDATDANGNPVFGPGDTLYGGDAAGTDTSADSLTGGNNSLMLGNQGNDTLVAGDGTNAAINASLYGGQGGDSLYNNTGSSFNSLWGDLGSDTLNANGTANNNLRGGDGSDSLFGGAGAANNTLDGGVGNDILIADDEILIGGVSDGGGNNSLWGGEGNDTLVAGNTVGSNDGNDTLIGGAGDDLFWGSSLGDTLGGQETRQGSDTLYGAGEADSLIGASGLFDGFYYANSTDIGSGMAAAGQSDTITSFESGTDIIYLRSSAFGNVDVNGNTVANLASGAGNDLRDNLDFFATGGNQDYTTLNGSFSGGSTTLPAIVFDSNGSGGGVLYWDINGGGTTNPGGVGDNLSVIATIQSGRVRSSDIVIF